MYISFQRFQHQDLYLLCGSLLETYNETIASAYWRAALSSQVRGSGVKNPFWKNPRWPPCLGLTRRALSCVSNKIVYKIKEKLSPTKKSRYMVCIIILHNLTNASKNEIYVWSKIYHKWTSNIHVIQKSCLLAYSLPISSNGRGTNGSLLALSNNTGRLIYKVLHLY